MAVRPSVGWKQTGKKKKDQLPPTISIWRGEKAGPCPRQLNGRVHASQWFFFRCHCHTQVPCVLPWLRRAGLVLQDSEGYTPCPRFTSISLCQGEGGKNHTCFPFSLFSAELIASGWPIFHLGLAGISPGTVAWWLRPMRAACNGKPVFVVTQAETARQPSLPHAPSPLPAGGLGSPARKYWGKLRARAMKSEKNAGDLEDALAWDTFPNYSWIFSNTQLNSRNNSNVNSMITLITAKCLSFPMNQAVF